MSYILDALTKAAQQRDRQTPVVQRLLSPAPRPRAPWSPASRRLLAALAVNAVLLATVLGWWMWPTAPATTQPAVTTQPAPVAAPAPIAESPRPMKLEPLPRVEPRVEKPTTATSERSVSTSETSSQTSSRAAPPSPSPAPTPSSRAAAPASSPRAAAPAPSSRAAAPAPAPAQSTLPRSGTPGVQPSTAPASPPVSAAPPLEAGSLKLEALIYADVPAERMVFINGRRYREGDSIDGRLRVEEIREDGVELSDQGRRFSLRVTSR